MRCSETQIHNIPKQTLVRSFTHTKMNNNTPQNYTNSHPTYAPIPSNDTPTHFPFPFPSHPQARPAPFPGPPMMYAPVQRNMTPPPPNMPYFVPMYPPPMVHNYHPFPPPPAHTSPHPPPVNQQPRAVSNNPQDLKVIEDYIVGLLKQTHLNKDSTASSSEPTPSLLPQLPIQQPTSLPSPPSPLLPFPPQMESTRTPIPPYGSATFQQPNPTTQYYSSNQPPRPHDGHQQPLPAFAHNNGNVKPGATVGGGNFNKQTGVHMYQPVGPHQHHHAGEQPQQQQHVQWKKKNQDKESQHVDSIAKSSPVHIDQSHQQQQQQQAQTELSSSPATHLFGRDLVQDEAVVEEEAVVNPVDTYNLRKQQEKAHKQQHFGVIGSGKPVLQLPSNFDKLSYDAAQQYRFLVPSQFDFNKRLKLLAKLQRYVNGYWPEADANLHMFGSSANEFGLRNADMDICLTISNDVGHVNYIVTKLGQLLRRKQMRNVKMLTRTRVPIVKFQDPDSGYACDICINNVLAIHNTRLLADYSRIDPRVRELGFLVKYWAKQRQINEPYQGTLSSYAYILMVIFYLQQRKPPVIPCLQQIWETPTRPTIIVDGYDCYYYNQIDKLKGFGSYNKESTGELLAGLFKFYAEFEWENMVISVRTGQLLTKDEKQWSYRRGLDSNMVAKDNYFVAIEDPFEITHNLGRVVDHTTLKAILFEFKRAYKLVCRGADLSVICKAYDANEDNK